MTLNKWHRTGIVLSVLWAAGAWFYQHNADLKRVSDSGAWSYRICTDTQELKHISNPAECEAKRKETEAISAKDNTGSALIIALCPIPFYWLTAYILIYFVRAQIVGLRAVVPWRTLTRLRKCFVAICVAFAGTVLFIAAVTVTNLYVDSKVPVSLGPELMVTEGGDGFVEATGTWITDNVQWGSVNTGTNPLQTSRIICRRDGGRCVEARAYIYNSTLFADATEYEIESWAANQVGFKNEELCYTEHFKMNIATQSVEGYGVFDKPTNDLCKQNAAKWDGKPWSFRMRPGFEVYWSLHQAARPYLLRVVHALFGN